MHLLEMLAAYPLHIRTGLIHFVNSYFIIYLSYGF